MIHEKYNFPRWIIWQISVKFQIVTNIAKKKKKRSWVKEKTIRISKIFHKTFYLTFLEKFH